MIIGQLGWEKTDLIKGLKTFDGYGPQDLGIRVPYCLLHLTKFCS